MHSLEEVFFNADAALLPPSVQQYLWLQASSRGDTRKLRFLLEKSDTSMLLYNLGAASPYPEIYSFVNSLDATRRSSNSVGEEVCRSKKISDLPKDLESFSSWDVYSLLRSEEISKPLLLQLLERVDPSVFSTQPGFYFPSLFKDSWKDPQVSAALAIVFSHSGLVQHEVFLSLLQYAVFSETQFTSFAKGLAPYSSAQFSNEVVNLVAAHINPLSRKLVLCKHVPFFDEVVFNYDRAGKGSAYREFHDALSTIYSLSQLNTFLSRNLDSEVALHLVNLGSGIFGSSSVRQISTRYTVASTRYLYAAWYGSLFEDNWLSFLEGFDPQVVRDFVGVFVSEVLFSSEVHAKPLLPVFSKRLSRHPLLANADPEAALLLLPVSEVVDLLYNENVSFYGGSISGTLNSMLRVSPSFESFNGALASLLAQRVAAAFGSDFEKVNMFMRLAPQYEHNTASLIDMVQRL